MTRLYAFFLVEDVAFQTGVVSSVLLKLQVNDGSLFSGTTNVIKLDERHTAVFGAEFAVELPDKKKEHDKMMFMVELCDARSRWRRDPLGNVKFDLEDPEITDDTRQRTHEMVLVDDSRATIRFKLAVCRRKVDENGPFFASASAVESSTEREVDEHDQLQVIDGMDEMLPSTPMTLKLSMESVASRVLDDGNNSEKRDVYIAMRRKLLDCLENHVVKLSSIALARASCKFGCLVYSLFQEELVNDMAPALLSVLADYQVMSLPGLSKDDFAAFVEPFELLMELCIEMSHSVDELVVLLATTIHFGVGVAKQGVIWTSVYLEHLVKYENFVDKIALLLTHMLTAAIGPFTDVVSDELEDRGCIESFSREIRGFVAIARRFMIPLCIVHRLVTECCRMIDILVFNALVDSESVITKSRTDRIKNVVWWVQQAFQFDMDGLTVSFSQTMRYVKIAAGFFDNVSWKLVERPSTLMRAIADRCDPPVPIEEKLEKLGETVASTYMLRQSYFVPDFRFTFKWMVAEEGVTVM